MVPKLLCLLSRLYCTAKSLCHLDYGLFFFTNHHTVLYLSSKKNNMMVFFDEFHTILCWVSQTLCISHFRYEIPWIIWCATVEQKKCNESQRKTSCCMTARHAFVSLVFFCKLFIIYCLGVLNIVECHHKASFSYQNLQYEDDKV